MSSSATSVATTNEHTTSSRDIDIHHNPSYPARVHFLERAELEQALRSCGQRLNTALQKLSALGNNAEKPRFVRLYHQLQGARDQVAEAVRRLPLEVGGLYHEDYERLKSAMEAFERIWHQWK